MAETPAGMKINFDEQNMTKWEVLMDGPDGSVYAVRGLFLVNCRLVEYTDHYLGRPFQARDQFP